MKIVLYMILCFPLMTFNTYSQFLSGDNAQILVKGIVLDENSNEPLGVIIELRTKDGKKIKTQSNSNTGLFEQLLPSGENYTVILSSDDIIRKEFEFATEAAKEFKEQDEKWYAVKPRPGARIFSANIFDNGSSNIHSSGQKQLKELQMLLRFNRTLYVAIELAGDKSITENRKAELSKQIDGWLREKSRIEIVSKESNQGDKDILVRITKVEEFLNR